MASFEKRGKSTRVRVYVNGKYASQTFPTKRQAAQWAMEAEAQLLGVALGAETMKDAFRRYVREVSPSHKGFKWETCRLAQLERYPLASKRLSNLKPADVAEWRDTRLTEVSSATVAREYTIIASVLETARKEWGWIHTNPARDIKKPKNPPSRKRRITQDEIDRLCIALGYEGGKAESISDRVALSFLFAIETAMRSSEILGLIPGDIKGNYAVLPLTKNGDVRHVPLSKRAIEILGLLPESDNIFNINSGTRGIVFRAAAKNAKIKDLHFHDARAEAIWRLSKKLDVMELARVIGHRDLRSLMIYYNAAASELADKLG